MKVILKEKGIQVKKKIVQKKIFIKKFFFFITSTSISVLPISQIDNTKLEIKPIIKEIMRIHKEFENNQVF